MAIFWCGSEDSYNMVLAAEAKTAEFMAAKEKGSIEDMVPPMYTREGSVGVVHINGPLVSGDAGFLRLFGITGYDNVREAVVKALTDKEAKSMMLSINSPGGAVNGVVDTASFITAASKIKPTSVFADTMASAAYWLGAGAGPITATETAMLGSIGILSVHTEVSKMNEKDGITRTVLRAGEYKALGNPHEPLSDEAKSQITAQMEHLYNIFADSMAEARGTSRANFDATMGRGREFIGSQAKAVNLVDHIGTYETALQQASNVNSANRGNSATISVANASAGDNNAINSEKGTEMKPTLTQEQLLAIAAGISDETAEGTTNTPAASTEEGNQTAAETSDVVTKEQFDALQVDLAAANVKLTEAQAAVDAGKQAAIDAGKTIEALAAIVSAATKSMMLALGSKTEGLEALSATDLVAKHAEVSGVFKTKFKAGGVAATSAETTGEQKPKVSVNPLFAAIVQSAKTK